MNRAQVIHNLVRDIYRIAGLKAEFAADPAAVLARYPLTDTERQALLAGSFETLHQVGMHPLVQMVYSMARHPELSAQLSVRDYLADMEGAS